MLFITATVSSRVKAFPGHAAVKFADASSTVFCGSIVMPDDQADSLVDKEPVTIEIVKAGEPSRADLQDEIVALRALLPNE